MFCTRCGTRLDETARFCNQCGKSALDPGPSFFASEPPPLHEGPSPHAYAHPGTATKRLRRIMAGKKIAGVCTGYAEYFNMDLALMRVIWVVLLLVPPNIGLFAYFISWAVLPKE